MPHTPSFLPIAENVHQRFQMPDECAHTSLMDWTSNTLPPETSHVFIRPLDNIDPRTKRENEFKLGRVVAEYQLAKLGHENSTGSIGVNDDRSPNWPAGYTGSISHSNQWLWVSVCYSRSIGSVGIDTEIIVPDLTRRQIQDEIAREDEWRIADQIGLDSKTTFTLVFSAKEAFYKCLYPLDQNYFGFKDAEVTAVSDQHIRIRKIQNETTNTLQLPTELDVIFHVQGNNVFTATWVRPQETA